MSNLKLEHARRIVAAALVKGRELGLKPLTVAVLDSGGHLIALERENGSSTLRPQIAVAKASGALALGVSSRKIGEMTLERPVFMASLANLNPAGVLPAAGGVIVVDDEGTAIGAVGITGTTSDEDEHCARAGIAAAGLKAQP